MVCTDSGRSDLVRVSSTPLSPVNSAGWTPTGALLLGERHLSPSRWACYYVRGEGAVAECVATIAFPPQ
jgi:hypothetical protein